VVLKGFQDCGEEGLRLTESEPGHSREKYTHSHLQGAVDLSFFP